MSEVDRGVKVLKAKVQLLKVVLLGETSNHGEAIEGGVDVRKYGISCCDHKLKL